MATRPGSGDPGGGPDSGEPEFGWLYGGRPGGPGGPAPGSGGLGSAAEPPPEHTRVMPVQPRPGATPTSPRPTSPRPTSPHPTAARPAVTPQPPAPAPTPGSPGYGTPPPPRPGTPYRSGGGGFGGFVRRRVTRPRFWIRLVLVLLLLDVVFTIAVPFITLKSVHEVAFEPNNDKLADQPGTTYLLVGSDSRKNLTAQQRREYHTGDPSENLSDTIMLLHTGSGPNVLLSIPRDSYVDIPGHGVGKINSAYSYGGAKLLTATIEQNTGVKVDKYVEIGLGGVAEVVDAVGGIQVCPEYNMDDPDAGLHIKKGCQEVDGQTALAYSRSRHAQRLGDLDRVKHQREVVAAIGHKVLSPWSVLDPVRWWKLNHAVPDFFTFGDGMGPLDVVKWASAMSHTTGKGGLTCTMPVTDATANHWDMSRAKPLLAAIIDDKTSDITPDECTPAGIVGAQ